MRRRLAAVIAAVAVTAAGCASEPELTYAELKQEQAASTATLEHFTSTAEKFWDSVHTQEVTMTQAREMVTSSMIDQLLKTTGQWSWDAAAKSLRAEHLFQPVYELTETDRVRSVPLSSTEYEVQANNTYLIHLDITSIPKRVQCDSFETWVAESGVWKLDSVDNSSCDYQISLAKRS